MTSRRRAAATLMTIAGFLATAGGIQATSAAWTDDATFAIRASTATTTTTPPPPPFVWPGGISAANDNTVITGIVWDISKPHQVCAEVRVTGAFPDLRAWQLRMNLNVAPWYFSPTSKVQTNGTATIAVENAGSLLITGQTRGGKFDSRTNNTPLTNALTAVVSLCNRNSPPPLPADPSWYSVTQVPAVWTDTQACVVVTATTTRTDLASSPFFYGWVGTVDLKAAKARIVSAGRALDDVRWTPNPNGSNNFAVAPTSFSPPQDTYQITSGYDFALRPLGGGADSHSITVCVHGR